MEAKEWRQSRMCKVCRWKILITFKELKGLHEQDGGQEEKVHSEDGNACLEVKSHRALWGSFRTYRLSPKSDRKPLECFKRETTQSDFYISTLGVVWRVNWSKQELKWKLGVITGEK